MTLPIQTTDEARAFLTTWMRTNFPTDRTFSAYIEKQLAGDFVFQLANALAAQPAAAWMTEDGQRVVTAQTMDGARRDGGAMLSSLRSYSIPLVRAPMKSEEA